MKIKIIFFILFATLVSGCARTGIMTLKQEEPGPKWVTLIEGSDIKYDKHNLKVRTNSMMLSNGGHFTLTDWNRYLKEYVESFPIENRDIILRAVSRNKTKYDKVERVIRFYPDSIRVEDYSRKSYVSIVGYFSNEQAKSYLKINYYGNSWIFAESFKMVNDGESFQSSPLKFRRDNYSDSVWEYVQLNLENKSYRNIAEKIISSNESIIRFQGRQYYSDLSITNRMRKDMEITIQAVDIINGK